MQVLVIDDDEQFTALLAELLAPDDFRVTAAPSGEEGLRLLTQTGPYALVLLDVMLPEMDGFEVLRRIRMISPVPVIMLTARGDADDRILGLKRGADDYLPKPFNFRELAARMEAILRRTPAPGVLRTGDLTIQISARRALCGTEALDLTSTEFDLLRLLVAEAGTPVTREELSRQVLGRAYSVLDRSLDNLISILRKKLPHGAERIVTVRHVGYLLAKEEVR